MSRGHLQRISLLAGAFAVFSWLFYTNAYLSDDAFLAFRVSDNLVRGFGLRFDVAERVQVFTAPLYLGLFSVLYALTHDPSATPNPDRAYWTAMALGYLLSAGCVALVALRLRASLAVVCFLLLGSSQAFVTFTSSGLETPLVYLLLSLFYLNYLFVDLERESSDPRARFPLFSLWLLAALMVVNRIDTMLLVLPATVHLTAIGLKSSPRKLLGILALASLPLLLWFGFAVVYFGSFLPNTYFAKTGAEVPVSVIADMARAYFELALAQDPITLLVIAAGGLSCVFSKRGVKTRMAWLGAAGYVGYLGIIGGDFLGFRFLAPPYLVSVLVLARVVELRVKGHDLALPALAGVALLVYGAATPGSPIRTWLDGPNPRDVRFYFQASAVSKWRPGLAFPFARYKQIRDTASCASKRTHESVVAVAGGGLLAFCAGPEFHMPLRVGISDPLIARLPVSIDRPFLPAHVPKAVPAGYLDTLTSGVNRIEDPGLASYYDKIRLLTRGAYFDADRWHAIWQLNFTALRRYRVAYKVSDPEYDDDFKYRIPPLGDELEARGQRL